MLMRRCAIAESSYFFLFFFFFQAEDGIRDWSVTGVQTCALPISGGAEPGRSGPVFRPHPQPEVSCDSDELLRRGAARFRSRGAEGFRHRFQAHADRKSVV